LISRASYGYITKPQLRQLLTDQSLGLNLTSDELDLAVR
jgi:hypothetical protein